MKLLSTCIPGMQDFAGGLINDSGGNVLETGEGLLIYSRKTVPDHRFLNNTFAVLLQLKRAQSPEDVLKKVSYDGGWLDRLYEHRAVGTFRIVTQNAGELVSVNRGLLERAEEAVAGATGMSLRRQGADVELWAVSRDGQGYFLLRVTRHKAFDKMLKRGELRPDLCELMIELGDVRPEETVLDPFAGHGAIPKALLQRKGVKIIAGDIAAPVPEWARRSRLDYRRMDALNLSLEAIDCVITDPPWGEYAQAGGQAAGIDEKALLLSLRRVLKPNGRIVLLSSRKDAMQSAFKNAGFSARRYDILVSGKKAAIFKA